MYRFLLVTLICLASLSTLQAQKQEMRGVWIASVSNLDWPSSKSLSPAAQRQSFTELLDGLQRQGINAVFMQIRPTCDAFYPSAIEPWSEWLTGVQGKEPQPFYDPLSFMIEETKARGMEFHAWLNPYRAVQSITGSSVAASHISKTHPQWMLTYGNSMILNPGIPDTRTYIIKVVMDIIKRYPVDGIHFDDYFYPYPVTGQTINDSGTFAEHNRGITNIENWRRDNINLFIKECRDSIKAFDLRIKYGISPFGIWKNRSSDPLGSATNGLQSFSAIYADSKKWVEEGWMDYVVPQIYWAFGFSAAPYEQLVSWWSNLKNPGHLYIGQGVYRLDPSSSTSFSNIEIPNQIRYNRNSTGVQGSLLFRAANLKSNLKGIGDSLKVNLYRYPSFRPAMKWLDSISPEPPMDLSLRYGEGRILLNWTRSGQAADGEYASQYAIYRFAQAEAVDIKNFQNIIHITDKDVNKYEDIFAIDPSQSYTYVVTALDRLHNESSATCRATIASKLTSIKEAYQSNIRIYPNPASGRLFIDFRQLEVLPTQLILLNLQGQNVKVIKPEQTIVEIDIHDLKPGLYFINADYIFSQRIVIY